MRENLDAVTRVRLTHSEVAALGSARQDTCAMDPHFYGAWGVMNAEVPHATPSLPLPIRVRTLEIADADSLGI